VVALSQRHYRPAGPPFSTTQAACADAWPSSLSWWPAHAATVARWWRKVRDKVDIEHRLHDLRHFYASGLIAAGCDVVTVQRALGHSSAAITLTTYSHLWPDTNDRTRKAAAGLFAEAIGSTADGRPKLGL
jgi:integrase